jgi:uncharacterized protein YvpB
MQHSLEELSRSLRRVQSAWISPRSAGFSTQADAINQKLVLSADELMRLSLRMQNEIDEWVSTDLQGASRFHFPTLGVIIGGITGGSGAFISISEGCFGSSGLSTFTLPSGWSLAGLIALISPIPTWIKNWLDELFGEHELISPLADEQPQNPGQTTFGDLLEEKPPADVPATSEPATPPGTTTPQTPVETSTETPKPVVTPPTDTTTTATPSFGYDVPVYSQGTLYGSAACLPTSVAMVTSYFHNQNSSAPAITADTLISTMDNGDGTYGVGVGIDKLNDEIAASGYQEPVIKVGASIDDLKNELNSGPVIVNTGVKVLSSGGVRSLGGVGNTNHSIVVRGISSDGTQVIVNDPWSGQEINYSMDEFSKIWSKGQSIMTSIRPR